MKPLTITMIFSVLLLAGQARASEPIPDDDQFQSSQEATDNNKLDVKIPGTSDPQESGETNVLCEGACNKR